MTGDGSRVGDFQTEIDAIRQELDRLTFDLVKLIAKREQLVVRIGRLKGQMGLRAMDERREAQVLETGSKAANELGVDPAVVQAVLRLLIAHARKLQEELPT